MGRAVTQPRLAADFAATGSARVTVRAHPRTTDEAIPGENNNPSNMLKTAAIIFGVFFIIAGIGGFVPGLAPSHGDGNMLFGIFMVGPVHNIIHLASGAAALLCGFAG